MTNLIRLHYHLIIYCLKRKLSENWFRLMENHLKLGLRHQTNSYINIHSNYRVQFGCTSWIAFSSTDKVFWCATDYKERISHDDLRYEIHKNQVSLVFGHLWWISLSFEVRDMVWVVLRICVTPILTFVSHSLAWMLSTGLIKNGENSWFHFLILSFTVSKKRDLDL